MNMNDKLYSTKISTGAVLILSDAKTKMCNILSLCPVSFGPATPLTHFFIIIKKCTHGDIFHIFNLYDVIRNIYLGLSL